MKSFIKGTYLKSAILLSAAGVICKILGALYRVPLTAVLGAEGLGIYQMAFPYYTALLTLSSTGIPTALAKQIAEGKDPSLVLKRSLKLFGGVGALSATATFFLAEYIAAAQGNIAAAGAFKALSPSLFFVSVLSCIRGYCLGFKNALPTAVTQITEQTIKLAAGLTLCTLLGSTPEEKAAIATFSVTISEAAAVIVALFFYGKARTPKIGESVDMKSIIKVVFPITLSAVMIPLSRVADGFLVINLLSADRARSTALYGIYSGAAESIVAMPVALCYAFAAAAVPEISSDKLNEKKRTDAVLYTLLISTAAAVIMYFAASPAVDILYGGLSFPDRRILALLIKISFGAVIGLSLVQTLGATFFALDKYYLPPLFLGVGIAAKIALLVGLLPKIGIFACAIADAAVYLFVGAAEFVYLFLLKGRSAVLLKSRTQA